MTPQNPTETRSERRESGPELHRRETRLGIWLPFFLTFLLVVALILLIALPSEPEWRTRVSFIADFMGSVLIFCPAIICAFAIYLVLVVAVWGMNRLHSGAASPLEKVENITANLANRVESATEKVNERVVDASTRMASLTYFMRFFDQNENIDGVNTSDQPASGDAASQKGDTTK
ncbi:hypothetical protein G4Y79_13310 [Phototrophicus methaneseepsis]|uniref:Uncharacterized protein n=1 Tax=Phototrophicus methaneseepsis TaxID=2710758 RepID=A0A7S8E5F5_9CHLR|nr:hypothetical protein [Phototrophicus methaneseepsis]QPC80690.1 hypothetical protein G4Y79_13310 [Phototrophicus methaneseepsis]